MDAICVQKCRQAARRGASQQQLARSVETVREQPIYDRLQNHFSSKKERRAINNDWQRNIAAERSAVAVRKIHDVPVEEEI